MKDLSSVTSLGIGAFNTPLTLLFEGCRPLALIVYPKYCTDGSMKVHLSFSNLIQALSPRQAGVAKIYVFKHKVFMTLLVELFLVRHYSLK